MSDPIKFSATVAKTQTLVDGAPRVTLDMPESNIMQMAMLAECQAQGIVLEITAIPIRFEVYDRTAKNPKRERKHLRKTTAQTDE